MATQGERRALYFLAAVALLGAGTRAWRGRHVAVDTTGLTRQIDAVDGLERAGKSAVRRVGRSTGKPAEPTADRSARPAHHQPVDLDTAREPDIEKLPGIGPALAHRIVKDRETNGPFGCLAALDRVKGIGPALLAKIDSMASFSAAGGAPCASSGRQPEGSRLQ